MSSRSRKVCGVGTNDVEYAVRTTAGGCVVELCPYYATWYGMLNRCYGKSQAKKMPSYKGCSVCDDWLLFSNFKVWMEQQDWQFKELDKDILKHGNKVYCPEFCMFVPKDVNSLFVDRRAKRGEYPIEVQGNYDPQWR